MSNNTLYCEENMFSLMILPEVYPFICLGAKNTPRKHQHIEFNWVGAIGNEVRVWGFWRGILGIKAKMGTYFREGH